MPASIVRPIAGVRLHAPGGASLALDSPGYFFLATDTPALMRWLGERARDAGVELALGEAWRGADHSGWRTPPPRHVVRRRRVPAPASARDCGPRRERALPVRRWRREIRGATLDEPNRLHCFLDAKRARGYLGWAFAGVDVVQVGLASSRAAHAPPPDLDDFLRTIAPRIGLVGGTVVAKRAGLIPVGGPVAPRAADRVPLAATRPDSSRRSPRAASIRRSTRAGVPAVRSPPRSGGIRAGRSSSIRPSPASR